MGQWPDDRFLKSVICHWRAGNEPHSAKLLEIQWFNGQTTDFSNLSYAPGVLEGNPHLAKLLETEWVNGQITDLSNLSYATGVPAMNPHSAKLLETEWVNGQMTSRF